VAELVEQELRAARQDAMKEKSYVAVVFPSEGGRKPHASAFYRLEGLQKPRLTRSFDLSSEYPGLSVFVGFWPLDASLLNDAAAGNTTALAVTQQDWDFSRWEAPFPLDHHIVFGPDGKVYSSSLPRFDNAYHLLVSEAIAYGGASLNGVRTFSPSRVYAPSTVTVSLGGYVGTSKGVLAQNGSVQVVSSPFDSAIAPARAPAAPRPTTSNPRIRGVGIFPKPEPVTLPPGVDATVNLNGYLTLEIRAEDDDGDRLFCDWTAEKVVGNGTAPGVFSAPVRNAMVWENGEWTSTWEWRPPVDTVPGDIFQLEATVSDETGRTVAAELGASGQGRVEVLGDGQIVYERGGDIWIVNADGTGERNLTNHPADDSLPTLSPDGNRISFISDRSGERFIYVMELDGKNVRRLLATNPGWLHDWSCWSPRGNELAILADSTPPYTDKGRLFLMSADGSNLRQITPFLDVSRGAWHPVHDIILLTGHNDPTSMYEVNLADNTTRLIANPGGRWEYDPTFSPDGTKVAFVTLTADPRVPSNSQVQIADYSPGSITNLRTIPGHGGAPCWSPDGTRIAFNSNRAGGSQLFVANADGSELRQITTGGGSSPVWRRDDIR
jgi:WD40 repeat protein